MQRMQKKVVLVTGAARGLGFAKLVSVGNESDIGVGEIVELLAADAETRTILLFLETVRDAGALERGARAAHAAGKPVVAYKLGRSKLGARLARSHTGALAGEDAALDAYFRACGIVRVDMLETLIEIGPLLAGRAPRVTGTESRAPRVAVVTTTGGGAASVVDRLGAHGIEIHRFEDGAIGKDALAYFEPVAPVHHWRERSFQAPCGGPVAAAHLQHVAKAFGGDDAGLRALALQQGIGADGRAVHDRLDVAEIGHPPGDALHEAL